MTAAVRRLLWAETLVGPADRRLAGRLGGVLYLSASAICMTLGLVAPGLSSVPGLLLVFAAVGGTWGALSVWVIPWDRVPGGALVAGTFAGVAFASAGMWTTGGAQSPVRLQVLFVMVYAAYFLRPALAAVAAVATATVVVLPLAVQAQPDGVSAVTQLLVEVSTLLLLGLVMIVASIALRRSQAAARLLGRRQATLGTLATSVASERPLAETLAMASQQLVGLLDADSAGIVRFVGEDRVRVLGATVVDPALPTTPVGTEVEMRPGGEFGELRRTGAAVRIDDYVDRPGSVIAASGWGSFVAVPILVAGEVWGALSATSLRAHGLPRDVGRRLDDVAEVVALAVAADASRRKLTEQALTDGLTGLYNRRFLQDRLEQETGRALRHGRRLAVALIDVDAFKGVNDSSGHEAGDRALIALADALRAGARRDDIVGRLGGDEFAVIFPEASALEALSAVERVRLALAQEATISFSAGICEIVHAPDADSLLRHADAALYCAKEQGRGLSWIYDPEIAWEMTSAQRSDRRRRSDALAGMRALARAIDAKDHGTREHSTRVAELATALAVQLGWGPEQVALLQEAGVLHDVGKIGVPDAVLLKPGRLTPEEYELVKQHAALGAQILDGALTPEQVAWVRGHHERPDGRGYPDGLSDDQLSDGAAILAVADAFDAMTASRPYGTPLSHTAALAECRRLAGRQFRAAVVEALLAVRSGPGPLVGDTA